MAETIECTQHPLLAFDRAVLNNILHYYKNYYELISKVVSILDSFVPKEIAGIAGCNLSVSHDVESRTVTIFYGEIIEEETEPIVELETCSPQDWLSDDEHCENVSQNVVDEVVEEILDSQHGQIMSPSCEVIYATEDDYYQNGILPLANEEQYIEHAKQNASMCTETMISHDTPPATDGPSSESVNPKYICQYVGCNETFLLAKDYTTHQENAHPWLLEDTVTVRCKYITCMARFNNIQLLRAHHATHRLKNASRKGAFQDQKPGPRRPVFVRKCEHCETVLDSRLNVYSQHCLEAHNRSPFACPLCTAPFHLQSHLQEHIKVEHSLVELETFIANSLWREFAVHDGVRLAECRHCLRVFYSRKSRERHAEQHQKELRKSCNRCGGKHYESRCSQPTAKYDGRLEKLYCAQCDRWMSKKNFKEHLVTHTMARNFPCTICKKTFKVRRTATRHIQNHINAGNCQRKCYDCVAVFADEREIPDHYREEHPTLRPYRCPICGEGFYEKAHLADHCHAHTDDERRLVSIKAPVASYQVGNARVYECTLCRRFFSTKRATIAHLIVHTDRPFVCSQCNLSFRVASSLDVHMVDVHQIKDVTIV